MNSSDKEHAFVKIYHAHIDEVYQYVFLRTGLEPFLAEEITQEIFLDVFKGFDKFRGLCSERTWVFKITRNKVYDYYRKQYKQCLETICIDAEPSVQISDTKQDIEFFIQRSYKSKCTLECLNRLPEHYKIILLLKYLDGRSVKEIAHITDKSNKSIDSVLQRAKSAFRKQYRMIQVEDFNYEK